MQLGFGWGKGRHVIKTTIAGESLIRALERQQRWVEHHAPAVLRNELQKLERSPAKKSPMVKAGLRSDPR
jgi:hypothetical protein